MYWEHLPRDQILGMNKRPAWVGCLKEEWLEVVHEAEKQTKQMTGATFSIIDNLVKDTTTAEILEKLEEEDKKYCAGTNNYLVWYTFAGSVFELPCNYNPVDMNKHALLEEELAHKNAAFQATVDQMQKKEAENEHLKGIGEKLDKLKPLSNNHVALRLIHYICICRS